MAFRAKWRSNQLAPLCSDLACLRLPSENYHWLQEFEETCPVICVELMTDYAEIRRKKSLSVKFQLSIENSPCNSRDFRENIVSVRHILVT